MYSQSVFEACDFFFKEQLEWLKTYLFVRFFQLSESAGLMKAVIFLQALSFTW